MALAAFAGEGHDVPEGRLAVSEEDNPLKEALKTFAGVGGKEEIEEVRSQDPGEEGVQDVPVPEERVSSAEALEDDGVVSEPSADVSRSRQEQ